MTECKEWTGGTSSGYGMVWIKNRNVGAHRIAYCKANNISLESIKGLVVRHQCDNPICVNPDHLLVGTHLDNAHDRISRGRSGDISGEKNGSHKLTDEQVHQIRVLFTGKRGDVTRIAKEFGVTRSCVSKILRGDRRVPTKSI